MNGSPLDYLDPDLWPKWAKELAGLHIDPIPNYNPDDPNNPRMDPRPLDITPRWINPPQTPPGKPKGGAPLNVFESQRLIDVDQMVKGRFTECANNPDRHIQWHDQGVYVSFLKGFLLDFAILLNINPGRAATIGLRSFQTRREKNPVAESKIYTHEFADTVRSFKTSHHILGPGQKTPDAIVGVRTILFIDHLYLKQEGVLV